ncbi:MAG: hypothetical protein H6Q14_2796 [Bacteroidetes bacterium]|jgi:uncharacterized protein|nr:hypothetical protein [Bacteroidota bacterium]
MDKERVKLKVLGFSFNQTQTGTYGLVLAEELGKRRLMVIVGTPEAQSIAFELQHSVPPRPLTHDLFRTFINKFKISLVEALIYKYENGVFFSQLTFEQNGSVIQIESRTSDAVAIALRTNSPIYTTENIMQELAVVFDENENVLSSPPQRSVSADAPEIEEDTIEELRLKLQAAINDENYELASILRDEISKKEDSNN